MEGRTLAPNFGPGSASTSREKLGKGHPARLYSFTLGECRQWRRHRRGGRGGGERLRWGLLRRCLGGLPGQLWWRGWRGLHSLPGRQTPRWKVASHHHRSRFRIGGESPAARRLQPHQADADRHVSGGHRLSRRRGGQDRELWEACVPGQGQWRDDPQQHVAGVKRPLMSVGLKLGDGNKVYLEDNNSRVVLAKDRGLGLGFARQGWISAGKGVILTPREEGDP